jgi:hypothetical protein
MGGMFGVVSRKDCVTDLFFGIDYHSHLGTKKGGIAVYGENGFNRAIHHLELSLKMILKKCLEKWGLVVFQTMNLNLF